MLLSMNEGWHVWELDVSKQLETQNLVFQIGISEQIHGWIAVKHMIFPVGLGLCQCVESLHVSEDEGTWATSPRFLHWFMSNAPVFGHCVLIVEDEKVERRRAAKESEAVEEGGDGERNKKQTKGRLEMMRRPNKLVVGSHHPFDRPQTPGTLLWNDKHVGHKSGYGNKAATQLNITAGGDSMVTEC